MDLDYSKCFDKISAECVLGALTYFGFPDYLITWVKILYDNFYVQVQNNGKFTDKIPVQRSVHQGGCMSVQLFLLCAELISIELRQCERIRGIPVDDIVLLLNQYADDTGITSLFDQESLTAILEKLDWFRQNTGFCLNYDKTSILRLGSLRFSDATLYTQQNILWKNDNVSVLGVTLSHEDKVLMQNYDVLIPKAKAVLNSWQNRGLSLFGKVCVINTLVASMYIYKLMVLPNIEDKQVVELNRVMCDYLWNGKKPKVALRFLQCHKKQGGANLTNIKVRQKAIKMAWPQILQKDTRTMSLVSVFLKIDFGLDVWQLNLRKKISNF